MEGFRPEHLDLDRLFDNLADAKMRVAQYRTTAKNMQPSPEKDAWVAEVALVEAEIVTLEQLIEEKKEFDRGERAAS